VNHIFSSGFAILMTIMPSMVILTIWPSKRRFLYGLAISSLSFFLCAYHVREKAILLPLLAVTLLRVEHPQLTHWMSSISLFR
jgi:hypothetical protein